MKTNAKEEFLCQKCGLKVEVFAGIDGITQSIYRVEIGYVQKATWGNVFISTGTIGYYCEKCLQEGVSVK